MKKLEEIYRLVNRIGRERFPNRKSNVGFDLAAEKGDMVFYKKESQNKHRQKSHTNGIECGEIDFLNMIFMGDLIKQILERPERADPSAEEFPPDKAGNEHG